MKADQPTTGASAPGVVVVAAGVFEARVVDDVVLVVHAQLPLDGHVEPGLVRTLQRHRLARVRERQALLERVLCEEVEVLLTNITNQFELNRVKVELKSN